MSDQIVLRCLSLLLVILAACGGGIRAPAAPDPATSAVAITTLCDSVGSGVIIDATHLLTAAHVVAPCPSAFLITDHAGAVRVARLEAVVDSDLARLRLVPGSAPFDDPGPPLIRTAVPGARVCIESGQHRQRRCGRIRGSGHGRAGLSHSAITIKGDSGSGLYGERGDLLGIVVTCEVSAGVCTRTGGGATPLAPVAWIAGRP